MERTRHRRSTSASGIEGTRQVKKQNAVSRFSPGSQSYTDENNWNNMNNGTPMKKLLAEEMSIEVEPKRRSPSVIARLMGLEVMPPPCHGHVHRQQKRSPAGHRKSVSVNNAQENSLLHNGLSNRRSSTDQQEYKDVYEDLEASHNLNHQRSSRWRGNSVLTRPKLPLIQKKFIDINYLSTDQQLQNLEELYGTPDMQDTDHDLLLQFLQQPKSLSVNNLHDQQVDSRGSVGCQIAVLKPLNPVRYASKAKSRRPLEESLQKHHVTSPRTREDGLLLESQNYQRVRTSYPSKFRSDDKNGMYKLPTKVVILKPNPVKTSAYADESSINSLHKTLPRPSPSSYGVESSMPISTKARRIAREITTNMRNGCDAIKGYAGDESSFDDTESDSESESEVFNPSSRIPSNVHKLCRYPCSYLGQTSVTKEAKKRISERWKMTCNYQDVEMKGNGSTLDEVLSLSERETKHRFLNGKMSLGRSSDRLGYNGHSVTRDRPIGISTRDSWKEEIVKGLSKSISLPLSRDHCRTPRMSTFENDVIEDKPMIHSGCVCHGKSNAVEENYKEHNSPRDSEFGSKKHCQDQQMFINETNSSSEASFEIQIEEDAANLTEQLLPFRITTEEDMPKNLVPDVTEIAEREIPSGEKPSTSDSKDSALQELPEQCSSSMGCFEMDPDPSSNNSKKADHSSPVSVLEVPSTEETPESFERVSTELHELRMQLQLLKMESGGSTNDTYIEEEPVQPPPIAFERNSTRESESWEISYTNDILTDCVIAHTAWHSLESPLDPKLFDYLENKYSNDTTEVTRSERRLLFDRVNSAVLEIINEQAGSLLMPKLEVKWTRKEDVIQKLMKDDFGADEGLEIVQQQQWEEWKGEMVVIGIEIEKLMIDDIIMEAVCY